MEMIEIHEIIKILEILEILLRAQSFWHLQSSMYIVLCD